MDNKLHLCLTLCLSLHSGLYNDFCICVCMCVVYKCKWKRLKYLHSVGYGIYWTKATYTLNKGSNANKLKLSVTVLIIIWYTTVFVFHQKCLQTHYCFRLCCILIVIFMICFNCFQISYIQLILEFQVTVARLSLVIHGHDRLIDWLMWNSVREDRTMEIFASAIFLMLLFAVTGQTTETPLSGICKNEVRYVFLMYTVEFL